MVLSTTSVLAGWLSVCVEKFRIFEGDCFIAMAMLICALLDTIYCLFLVHWVVVT